MRKRGLLDYKVYLLLVVVGVLYIMRSIYFVSDAHY